LIFITFSKGNLKMSRLVFDGGDIWVLVWLAAIVGWVANIVKMCHHLSEPLSGMEILRMIGIIAAPLGAVLGYC
jgi:hypothetical protein